MAKLKMGYMYDAKGKKTGVVLLPKQFEKLIEEFEDWQDYDYAMKHGGKKGRGVPLELVMAQLEKRK